MKWNARSGLLAGVTLSLLAAPAFAAGQDKAQPQTQAQLDALQQQIRALDAQLQQIKQTQADSDPQAALSDLKRSTSDQYVDINNQIAAQTKVNVDNGRLTATSADGRFSVSLRSLIQFDYGYYGQGKNPAAVDLSSGSNFRRAQVGVVGTAWRDWSYNFTYDFGGNGAEKNGYLYYAYAQYDGLGPIHARFGAFAPFVGIEDGTGSGDLLFLERATISDVTRNIAGSPGREGAELFAQGSDYLFSLAYTGKKATDAATFDAQEAFVGRASWLAVNEPELKWLLDADGSYVFKTADVAANNTGSNVISFSNGPELGVDSTKTINTGNIDASKVTQFGAETAAEFAGFYGQAGWSHYQIQRRLALPDPHFDGWYALLTYSLTGENHAYDPTTASFRSLKPAHSLGDGGWGAWELAGRYSTIDLDYQPFKTAATGGIPGGKQNVWTLGLNWYPTNGVRFQFDYYNIRADHVNAPAGDISANAFGIRSQLQF